MSYASTSGGGITILAAGSIVITSTGSISAAGVAGPFSEASAGGIEILASRTSISNAGALIATGANSPGGIGGGGGGGGIIHLLGPSLVLGNTNVSGGSGSNGVVGESLPGGACGGSGGAANLTGGSPGGAGYVFTTIVSEPPSLFVP